MNQQPFETRSIAGQFRLWQVYLPVSVLVALALNFAPGFLAIPFGVLLVAHFWKYRDRFVYFLLIYTPFEELILKFVPENFYAPLRYMWEIILMLFLLRLLIENGVLKRKRGAAGINNGWKKSIIDNLALGFVAVWLLSGIFNSIEIKTSLQHLKNYIRYIPVFYIIYNLRPDYAIMRKFVYILFLSVAIQSSLCLLQAIDGDFTGEIFKPREVILGGELVRGEDVQRDSYYTRFTGSFARSNDLGNYLAFGLCFLVAFLMEGNKKGVFFLIILTSIALLISSSRISLLSAYLGTAVVLFLSRHKYRWLYLSVPLVLIIFLIIFQIAGNESLSGDFNIANRFMAVFSSDYIENISNFGRLYAVFYAVPASLFHSPLFGIGPGSFMYISRQMSADETYGMAAELGLDSAPLKYVHDVGYAALLIQVGVLGAALLIWIFIRLYRAAKYSFKEFDGNSPKWFMLGAAGFFVALAIQNLASSNLMYRNQSLLVWSIAGLVALFSIGGNMRILIANKYLYPRGGDCIYTLRLMELLESKGHEVIPFSMRHPENITTPYDKYFVSHIDFRKELKKIGFKSGYRVARRIFENSEAAEALEKLIITTRPDIIHLQNIHHQLTPSILEPPLKYGIPVVWTLHDFNLLCPDHTFTRNGKICMLCADGSYHNAIIHKCKKNSFSASVVAAMECAIYRPSKILHKVSKFICPSQFMAGVLISHGIPSGKVSVINNFQPAIQPRNFANEYFIYAGRLSPEKGLDQLLEAFSSIEGIRLLIAGDGPDRERLKLKAGYLNLKNVNFLGNKSQDELFELIGNSLAVIVPSVGLENFPYSVLEAMALRKPVIASRIGGIPEQVIDGESGLLFEPGNVAQLRGCIKRIIEDKEYASKMGLVAYERATRLFDFETHYKNLLNVYHEAIDRDNKAIKERAQSREKEFAELA